MSATPGLVPNLRLDQPVEEELSSEDVIVEIGEDDDEDLSGAANLLEIEHPDGSISISLDGRPIIEGEERDRISGLHNAERRGRKQGERNKALSATRKLLAMNILTHEQIAQAVELPLTEVEKLAAQLQNSMEITE